MLIAGSRGQGQGLVMADMSFLCQDPVVTLSSWAHQALRHTSQNKHLIMKGLHKKGDGRVDSVTATHPEQSVFMSCQVT